MDYGGRVVEPVGEDELVKRAVVFMWAPRSRVWRTILM